MVTKKVTETVGEVGICDFCGKEFTYYKLCGNEVANYYHITTGHHDWGNDSCESRQEFDACSDECLSRASSDWIKDPDVRASHTAYFEVEKDRHWLKRYEGDTDDNNKG